MFLGSLLAAKWYPILFDSPLNIARAIFFWLAIALALSFLVDLLYLKGDFRKKVLKITLLKALCFACAVGVILLVLTFVEDGIAPILFYPLLVLIVCIGASATALFLKPKKLTAIITGCVSGAAAIALFVCMGVFYESGEGFAHNWITDPSTVSQLGLYLSAALLVVAIIVATLLLGRKEKKGYDSKAITLAAICIAMSFALSYLRVVKLPQGGSITIASLVPLMIYAYIYGVKKGVFAGLIYGILQAFQGMTILHPAQFLLDYPVAFACVGFAGVFGKVKALEKLPQVQIALGGIVAGLARYLCHFLSGVFAFGEFAPAGQPVWIYSLAYQAGYVLPDIAIAIGVAIFLFSSRALVKQMRSYNKTEAPEAPAETSTEE